MRPKDLETLRLKDLETLRPRNLATLRPLEVTYCTDWMGWAPDVAYTNIPFHDGGGVMNGYS